MAEQVETRVTSLLIEWQEGKSAARDQLLAIVYDELRQLARSYLRRESPGHTLQPTALVGEAYLRLVDQRRVSWRSRSHFFGIAAQMMRRVLVDHARSRRAEKRGGDLPRLSLDEALGVSDEKSVDLIALDDALTALAELDPRQGRIVELRFFGGFEVKEVAEILEISPATVKREWAMAKAWLHREISQTSA